MKVKVKELIVSLRQMKLETLRLWIQVGVLVVSAIALLHGAHGISKQRQWDRAHFAVEMINQWDVYSRDHKAAIEAAYPELIKNEQVRRPEGLISYEEAHCLYYSTPENDPLRWEIRNHCISLLNYFEFVTAAWEEDIADHAVIEDSFKSPILRWHGNLQQFMYVMQDARQYEPWQPLQRVVNIWKGSPVTQPRPAVSDKIICIPRPIVSPSPLSSPPSERRQTNAPTTVTSPL
jgi:hypothetical protein